MRRTAVILAVFIVFCSPLWADILIDQAVSWTDFSHITCIGMGNEIIYFGSTEGILRYNRFDKEWYEPITVSDGMPDEYILRLAVSQDDEVVTMETQTGIYAYDIEFKRWTYEIEFPFEYYRNSEPALPLPPFTLPFGFNTSSQGYIGDQNFREFDIMAYLDDDFDNIFLGTWGMGPVIVNRANYYAEIIPFGLVQKRTDAIYIEGDSVWLAGNEGDRISEFQQTKFGVTLFEQSEQKFTWFEPRYIYGFDSEIIFDIKGDDKNIYFAGLNGVTIKSRKHEKYKTLTAHNGLPRSKATALAIGKDSVWIGTYQGLALYTPSADTIVIISESILGNLFITDLELADSKLIIGSTDGAYYIDFRTLDVGRLKDPGGNLMGEIRHIAAYDNEVLISSSYGVTVINLKTERSEQVPFTDNASGAYAAAANDKYFAVAVMDGLALITRGKTNRFSLFTTDDGLLSNRITAIVPDGDYLWLGSDEGLTKFNWMHPGKVD